jgi:hypothetical protein
MRYIILFLFSTFAQAAGFSLAWTAPATGPTPSGYVIFYGTASGVYGTPVDAGNVLAYSVNNLTPGVKYYAAVKSYIGPSYTARTDLSAAYSNEVSVVVPNPLQPPTITIQPLAMWKPAEEINDGVPYIMGTKFTPTQNGTVSAAYYWKAVNEPVNQSKTAQLFDAATGRSLRYVNFRSQSTPGWQKVDFATPIAITAGKTYVVAVNRKWYGYIQGSFPADNPVLTTAYGAGVYGTRMLAMPKKERNNYDYGTDVLFTASNK